MPEDLSDEEPQAASSTQQEREQTKEKPKRGRPGKKDKAKDANKSESRNQGSKVLNSSG